MPGKICILGLGLMGSRAAARLVDCGQQVVAWNRTSGAATQSVGRFATIAATSSEAVAQADTVLMFLHDAEAVDDVIFKQGAAGHFRDGALLIDMGTNTPQAARQIAKQLPPTIRFADAPVSGGTIGIEKGILSIFLGANSEDAALVMDRIQPLGRVSHMGEIGAGQATKLANQIVVACNIAGLAEGVAFGEALGIAPENLLAALKGGLADSRVLEVMGPRIHAEDFQPKGRATTHLKDLACAFSQVDTGENGLEATKVARSYLQQLLENHGDLDHSAMLLSARENMSYQKNNFPQKILERAVNK